MTRGVCGEEQLLAAVRSEVAAVNGEMNNALRVGEPSIREELMRVETPEPMRMKAIG